MNKQEIIKQIKSKTDKLNKIVTKAAENGDLSGLETEIIIDNIKAIYDLTIDLAYSDIPEEQGEADEASSLLESILGELPEEKPAGNITDEIVNPASAKEEEKEEEVIETEIRTTTFNPPIDPAIINSLYGDNESADEQEEDAQTEPIPEEDESAPDSEEEPEAVVTINEITEETLVFNETIETSKVENLADALSAKAVNSLRESIGINDKFLLMRDLFDNDQQKYSDALDRLDSFGDINDAFIFLQENFTMNPDNEGVKLLISLLERKNA